MQGSFPTAVVEMRDSLIVATMDVYKTSMAQLLPTPTKSHYLFNLRDVARVMGGLLMLPSSNLSTGSAAKEKYMRLWTHEIMRVFYDRCELIPLQAHVNFISEVDTANDSRVLAKDWGLGPLPTARSGTVAVETGT